MPIPAVAGAVLLHSHFTAEVAREILVVNLGEISQQVIGMYDPGTVHQCPMLAHPLRIVGIGQYNHCHAELRQLLDDLGLILPSHLCLSMLIQ